VVGSPLVGGPLPIVDRGTVVSDLVVGPNVTLTDLNVHVHLTHSWIGDLILTLESPSGTQVTLLDRPGVPADTVGCDDNNMDVTFDDASSVLLEDRCTGDATPWYAGTGQPVALLSAFNGESTAGTWRLSVSDNAQGDDGILDDWTIVTTPAVTGTCRGCGFCIGAEIAVNTLYAVKTPAGEVALTLPAGPSSSCAAGIQVRLAPTGRPAAGIGSFPTDPPFADVTTQDLDPGRDYRHVPPAGSSYYKVVEDLGGGAPGPSGSYGF
jgi:subtilisin-like proprotein convertase family protein